MDPIGYAPDFRIELDGEPMPPELRVLVSAVRCETGVEGVDQAEITLVNDALELLDEIHVEGQPSSGSTSAMPAVPLTRVFAGGDRRRARVARDGAPDAAIDRSPVSAMACNRARAPAGLPFPFPRSATFSLPLLSPPIS